MCSISILLNIVLIFHSMGDHLVYNLDVNNLHFTCIASDTTYTLFMLKNIGVLEGYKTNLWCLIASLTLWRACIHVFLK